MIYVKLRLLIPNPNEGLQPVECEVQYQEDTGDEYETAVDAVRAVMTRWATEGLPNEQHSIREPHFLIVGVHDEWGSHDLPIPPCIRCGDSTIEYREVDSLCAYCTHVTRDNT